MFIARKTNTHGIQWNKNCTTYMFLGLHDTDFLQNLSARPTMDPPHDENEIKGYDNCDKFFAEVEKAGIDLSSGEYTVFAPVNSAMEKFASDGMSAEEVKYHIAEGKFASGSIGSDVMTLTGKALVYERKFRKVREIPASPHQHPQTHAKSLTLAPPSPLRPLWTRPSSARSTTSAEDLPTPLMSPLTTVSSTRSPSPSTLPTPRRALRPALAESSKCTHPNMIALTSERTFKTQK